MWRGKGAGNALSINWMLVSVVSGGLQSLSWQLWRWQPDGYRVEAYINTRRQLYSGTGQARCRSGGAVK